MMRTLRGEAGARNALLLALICATGWLSGCRHTDTPRLPQRFVRVESLLPLHPAWSQIETLDRIRAGFAAPSGEMTVNTPPFPSAFPFTQTTPANLAKERQNRVQADADAYLKQWTAFVTADNAQRLEREVQAVQRRSDVLNRHDLAQRAAQMNAEMLKERSRIDREIYRLGFTVVVYESQTRAFLGKSKQDAQDNLKATRDKVRDLTRQRDALKRKDFRALAAQELQDSVKQRKREAASFRHRREEELAAELQTQIANRRQQLMSEAQAVATVGRSLPDTLPPPAAPPPAAPDGSVVARTASAQTNAALAQQRQQGDAQRERLLAVLRRDTEQAVVQIAEREGWQPVPAGTPRAADATADVAKALRAQWQQQAAQ